MDNAWSFLAANSFDSRIVSEHGVDQRPTGMTGGGMNDHPGRFVNYEQIIVLKQNIKWNIFRNQIARHGWRNPNHHIESAFERLACFFRGVTVDIHKTVRNQSLDP